MLYINLDRSVERRERMETELSSRSIQYERIAAVDGNVLYADGDGPDETFVKLPKTHSQTPGEIGCALSHIRAAQVLLDRGHEYALIMEDDIHLTFYEEWRIGLRGIVENLAPPEWQVLQLTVNNVRVLRTLLGLGTPFVGWRKNHWSTGAYLLRRSGALRVINEYVDNGRFVLPSSTQLVSDVLMFNGPSVFTFTRPLFDHEIAESTIHQAHVEGCHRQASELGAAYYKRFDLTWAGGDDCRAAISCKLNELGRHDQIHRLQWWLMYHMRLGFRWFFFTGRRVKELDWIGPAITWCEECLPDEATARAKGASWLIELKDDELFYVLPGRSLKSVFDQGKKAENHLLFDSLECQRSCILDSSHNSFEHETLFKRRHDHSDGSAVSAEDDRAIFVQNSGHFKRLPPSKKSQLCTSPEGRIAHQLSLCCSGSSILSTRGYVLSFHESRTDEPRSNNLPQSPTSVQQGEETICCKSETLVYLALPAGCARCDCGGAYSKVDKFLYAQQGGSHHLYRISTPFVAWMVGRTPFSSTAALVAHDLSLQPEYVRAPWSAFDGRRWAVVPNAHVRQETANFAVITAKAVLATELDTMRALMPAPARFATTDFFFNDGVWHAGDRTFTTAEEAEEFLASLQKRKQRESFIAKVAVDSGGVLVDLPKSCGAASEACAGIYVPVPGKEKVFRHEEGAHYLYFYSPFSAWMIGSRPGSGSAALIAYDSGDRPDLIALSAPWRVYDGTAWRQVCGVKVTALQAKKVALLEELPTYPWTPTCWQRTANRKKNLVFTCAGDKSELKSWFKNGEREFDVWITYYGNEKKDKWREYADKYRRRKGGKFENLCAFEEDFSSYDAVWVADDDVVIDAPRINRLFEIRAKFDLVCLQPAFERRGKISHAVTAVQPGNNIRLTNFVEMTCPLFATPQLSAFLELFDPALKGWGADWWFLDVCKARESSQQKIAVVDAVSCINPTDRDKTGVREINNLQARDQRRACWDSMKKRCGLQEWQHLQFATISLDDNRHQQSDRVIHIPGTRPYAIKLKSPPSSNSVPSSHPETNSNKDEDRDGRD